MKDPNELIPVVERPGEIGIEDLPPQSEDQISPDDDPTGEDPPDDDEHQHPRVRRPAQARERKDIE
jgi:hypothetical protein